MTYQPTFFTGLPKDRVLPKDISKGIEPYVFSEEIVIAVDVALATRRPLLVSGHPGCGKSRLADAIAAAQGWSLLSKTMTSRTRLESLTVEVDQLRRLNDAQVTGQDQLKPGAYYLNPGLFWWAFQPRTAERRGLAEADAANLEVALDYPGLSRTDGDSSHAVLLIDEIDKAEPDLPNDLLEPLDRRRFDLPEGYRVDDKTQIQCQDGVTLLTVITTNGERELPQAFLRRCVTLELQDPDADQLVDIAEKHFPHGNKNRIKAIAKKMEAFRSHASDLRRRPPGTSEFLDAIRACEDLNIAVSDDENSVWNKIEQALLIKDTRA